MKRETSRLLKALDMDVVRAGYILQNLIRDRAKLDQESTKQLVAKLAELLADAALGEAEQP